MSFQPRSSAMITMILGGLSSSGENGCACTAGRGIDSKMTGANFVAITFKKESLSSSKALNNNRMINNSISFMNNPGAVICNKSGFLTKKFFCQQGEDKMVAEMYLGTLSTPFYLKRN